ncbi:MAG TPA: bifunctional DNA-formamidopyrimidine glycosylase/DNA-(apurinic or apyrimidinic site) lyase, partial [bacterium]|nr:bifunctional DNA-formamidopyrimidine glycosylase/DNA-(apurinic or apyrimidinic site) lyase [bacterium]
AAGVQPLAIDPAAAVAPPAAEPLPGAPLAAEGVPAGPALGPEPLDPDFTPARWRRILAGRKARIKSLLLDQQAVAGLGNIYAAEALFRAAIRPDRPAGSLSGAEAGRLYRSMRAVLKEALAAGGTSIQDYRQADGRSGLFQVSLRVYGRRGEACPCCGAPIEACREGSRTTYFCPGCQH